VRRCVGVAVSKVSSRSPKLDLVLVDCGARIVVNAGKEMGVFQDSRGG
jgi:hypothetical protein